MKSFLVVFWLTLFPILGMCFQEKNDRAHATTVLYELYSWRDSDGQWCFSILTMTNRSKTPEEVFDKKQTIRGIVKLKENISRFHHNSELVWRKNPWEGTSVKDTESVVVWPPEEVMNEVKRFAATKHVQVVW